MQLSFVKLSQSGFPQLENLGLMPEKARDLLDEIEFYGHSRLYQVFFIWQGSKRRLIHKPRPLIREIQDGIIEQIIAPAIQRAELWPDWQFCITGKGIVHNAYYHYSPDLATVANADLEDAYPSTTSELVVKALIDQLNLDWPLAHEIGRICTFDKIKSDQEPFLPQGAPTSPILFKLASLEASRTVSRMIDCLTPSARFSQYEDDLTVSFHDSGLFARKQVKNLALKITEDVAEVFQRSGYRLNPGKSRATGDNEVHHVTGLCLSSNENSGCPIGIRVPRKTIESTMIEFHRISRGKKNLARLIGLLGHIITIEGQLRTQLIKNIAKLPAKAREIIDQQLSCFSQHPLLPVK